MTNRKKRKTGIINLTTLRRLVAELKRRADIGLPIRVTCDYDRDYCTVTMVVPRGKLKSELDCMLGMYRKGRL